jgi:hypothetical protein
MCNWLIYVVYTTNVLLYNVIVKYKTRSLHNSESLHFQQTTSKPEANLELKTTAAYSQEPDMKSKDKANHPLEVDILISILKS